MSNISFFEYCADFLDLHADMLTEEQKREAYAGYNELMISASKAKAADPRKEKKLDEAKEGRQLAKFYGGKALKGTPSQKAWAEKIREEFLQCSAMSDDEKKELMAMGGDLQTSRFWIDNRFVKKDNMKPKNLKKIKDMIEKKENRMNILKAKMEFGFEFYNI
jgi:hypothetical protein